MADDAIDPVGGAEPAAGGNTAQEAAGLSPQSQAWLLQFQQQLQMQSVMELNQMVAQSQSMIDGITGGVGGPMDMTGSQLFANGPLGSMTGGANPMLNGMGGGMPGMGMGMPGMGAGMGSLTGRPF